MEPPRFLGLHSFQWILLLVVCMTALLLSDAWAGHYRRDFVHVAQYTPFPVGGLLILCALGGAIAPQSQVFGAVLQGISWLSIAAGLAGFAFHHYYGMVRKPGGYRRWLDSLMYGAPPLAPLALSLMGALALTASRAELGHTQIAGVSIGNALLIMTVAGLLGTIAQAAILHFRGAFNNPLMYAPLTVPLLAVLAAIWMLVAPSSPARAATIVLLWLTFLTGFVGLGMHLRGFDRQMAGLYVPLFNWLQGPPAFAPALFAGLAALGLVVTALP
jgi:hypothetical protein